MRQNCRTLKANTLCSTGRSKSVACIIKTAQLFNCQAAYIIYFMLAYERLCTKNFSLINRTAVEHRKKCRLTWALGSIVYEL